MPDEVHIDELLELESEEERSRKIQVRERENHPSPYPALPENHINMILF